MKKTAVALLFLTGFTLGFADVPVRTENLVYSILACTGVSYTPTFTRQESDTVYLIAGLDSFLTMRKTLVYYWPLTMEWRMDTKGLNIPFEGALEVVDSRGETIQLLSTRYTYYNVRGEYELNWKVALGADADSVWSHWSGLLARYNAEMRDYNDKTIQFQTEQSDLIAQITKLRNAGLDAGHFIDRMTSLVQPKEPEYPNEYVVPPVEIQEAFIVDLRRGEYLIHFRNPDGSILEGSDKKLIAFEKRRAEGIGYEVIPGDKWTRPVESTAPSSVLYTDGSSDLFLQPFFQDEFPDLYYSKMIQNDARGNAGMMRWVRIQQVPKGRIRLTRSGAVSTVTETRYAVEQNEGSSPGYRIVPFDPKGVQEGKTPDLVAFQIPLDRKGAAISIETLDKDGAPLAGSDRQIRVLDAGRGDAVLLLFALVPLCLTAAMLIRRARSYSP
jgi:hypothetical protein